MIDPAKHIEEWTRAQFRAHVHRIEEEAKMFLRMGFEPRELVLAEYGSWHQGTLVQHVVPRMMIEGGGS